ncbi:MAG TPA: hypothetical protein VLA52_12445 [Thermohalobaculum sp.]|nr:hypothetical protein [Thermohalobaculum sp.]
MFLSLVSRMLPAPESPTSDLYFFNACSDFLDAGVTRLAPTVFTTKRACVVMRHGLGAPRLPPGRRLIYLIDDEVEDGVADSSLPFLYRQKLRLLERPARRNFVPMAEVAVVSSPDLASRRSPGLQTRLLHPYWSEPIAGQQHFDAVLRGEGWIDIAFLGSSVHRTDLDFLWPVVCAVLNENPRVRFHLAERHAVPGGLVGHPRILRIPGRGWAAYRAGLGARRFHLALYPLMDTPFNRARSVNKLIEHGVAGAAALYSRNWAEAWRAGQGGAGIVLRNRREDWLEAIRHLLAHPRAIHELACGAAALARQLNLAEPQRRLWTELLGLDADAA